MAVTDYSGQAWLQGFNDVGALVFNKSADEMVAMREEDESTFASYVHGRLCRYYDFSVRAKTESFNVRHKSRLLTSANAHFFHVGIYPRPLWHHEDGADRLHCGGHFHP